MSGVCTAEQRGTQGAEGPQGGRFGTSRRGVAAGRDGETGGGRAEVRIARGGEALRSGRGRLAVARLGAGTWRGKGVSGAEWEGGEVRRDRGAKQARARRGSGVEPVNHDGHARVAVRIANGIVRRDSGAGGLCRRVVSVTGVTCRIRRVVPCRHDASCMDAACLNIFAV